MDPAKAVRCTKAKPWFSKEKFETIRKDLKGLLKKAKYLREKKFNRRKEECKRKLGCRCVLIRIGGLWIRNEVFGKNEEDPEIECSQHYLSFCLSLLPRLVDQSVLKRMPTSEKEIEALCHGFTTEMECFNRYASKCLIPRERQLIDVYSSGAKNIYKHLCNDKFFRAEYLRHTRCFKGTQSDWESCVNRFVELLKDELNHQNLTKETRVLHTCCAIHGFSRCVFVPGTMKCERDDALFLLKLTEISIDRQKYYRDCRSITNYTICSGCTPQTSCIFLITGYLILRISN